ncbi:MAG TPA: pyruvate kinase [Bacteroidia bacterium]|nr:pyruvate kinase [Bacteroidia bacterium]
MIPSNKTKIVATIGPASSSADMLRQLMLAGVDVCRLNLSHGDYNIHRKVIEDIRAISKELNCHTAILVDLQGPKLRIGEVENNEMMLETGEEIVFTTHECMGKNGRLYMNYQQFPQDVAIGDSVLIDDGKIQLRVVSTNRLDEVHAIAESRGKISSRKGVNLPRTKISLPSLTAKDLDDLTFALEQNVDWIGLSFVRSAKDIVDLKGMIKRAGKKIRVIAKIEKPEALNDIDYIIHETDALMVARGDLGVELPMEQVPIIQKMLVNKCIQAAKPVIIATQMMETMITNYSPTRAEVNDVANSVMDGADAVMLSGETSVGLYPVKVVEYMRNIIKTVEEKAYHFNREHKPDITSKTFISDSACYNACVMASQVGAKAIVGMTRSGYTAYKVAGQRPQADILIFTDVPSLLNVLSLVWGVRGFYYDHRVSTDETIDELQKILKEQGCIQTGDIIINLASIPLSEQGRTNMIKLGRVKGDV